MNKEDDSAAWSTAMDARVAAKAAMSAAKWARVSAVICVALLVIVIYRVTH